MKGTLASDELLWAGHSPGFFLATKALREWDIKLWTLIIPTLIQRSPVLGQEA